MIKKRIGILTGGGDVPPLNAVIASVKKVAQERGIDLIGFVKGWQGVLENQYIDMSKIQINPMIGGTILKSSRVNLRTVPRGGDIVQKNLHDAAIDGLIVIGGEDSLSNSFLLSDVQQVLISKTIDNDVGVLPGDLQHSNKGEIINYFTLGHPTAAQKIASFVSLEGLRTTAYSHERIIVVEAMGMHAGWLALSSSMGHPDFIIIPEFPLDYEEVKERIAERYNSRKHVIIVVAEGARFKGGSYISADENERDDFGHPRFKGSAESLSKKLKEDLKTHFDCRNINAVNPSYLYRAGSPSDLDFQTATMLGKEAANIIADGLTASVLLTVRKDEKGFSCVPLPLSQFRGIEDIHRFVDKNFYDVINYSVTNLGKEYFSSFLVESPPDMYGIC